MVAHEYAHGYAALTQGDDTAQRLGRLTLNPVRHIDPFLTILVPMMLLFASGASAFTQLYRFQYCSSMHIDKERLDCYDNYARELGLAPPGTGSHVSATQDREGSCPQGNLNRTLGSRARIVVRFFGGWSLLTTPIHDRCRDTLPTPKPPVFERLQPRVRRANAAEEDALEPAL